MKTFIFTALLLWVGLNCFSQTKSAQVYTSFNGFHCDGKPGLCSIDNQENRSLTNTLLQLNNDNTLTFIIERQQIDKTEFENVTGTKREDFHPSNKYYFEVPNAFFINQSVSNKFIEEGITLVISKGRYPIQITEKELIIVFDLE